MKLFGNTLSLSDSDPSHDLDSDKSIIEIKNLKVDSSLDIGLREAAFSMSKTYVSKKHQTQVNQNQKESNHLINTLYTNIKNLLRKKTSLFVVLLIRMEKKHEI